MMWPARYEAVIAQRRARDRGRRPKPFKLTGELGVVVSGLLQARGELRRELARHLRSGRSQRKPQGRHTVQGRLVGMTPISARPAKAHDRAVPGHWEGDLLMGGRGKGAVITLVERSSWFVLLAPLPDSHTAIDLRGVLTPTIASLPEQLRKTLTWDQGKEMAQHAQIAIDADIDIYFADPHSPRQRGSNESPTGC